MQKLKITNFEIDDAEERIYITYTEDTEDDNKEGLGKDSLRKENNSIKIIIN